MKGQRIGYIRTSTTDQNTARQLDGESLDKVFTEQLSGKDRNRPQLALCLEFLREGDTLVCHSLDRLGRNVRDPGKHPHLQMGRKGIYPEGTAGKRE